MTMENLLLVKVGSDSRPASIEDIKMIEAGLKELLGDRDDLAVFVTHHSVSIESIPIYLNESEED